MSSELTLRSFYFCRKASASGEVWAREAKIATAAAMTSGVALIILSTIALVVLHSQGIPCYHAWGAGYFLGGALLFAPFALQGVRKNAIPLPPPINVPIGTPSSSSSPINTSASPPSSSSAARNTSPRASAPPPEEVVASVPRIRALAPPQTLRFNAPPDPAHPLICSRVVAVGFLTAFLTEPHGMYLAGKSGSTPLGVPLAEDPPLDLIEDPPLDLIKVENLPREPISFVGPDLSYLHNSQEHRLFFATAHHLYALFLTIDDDGGGITGQRTAPVDWPSPPPPHAHITSFAAAEGHCLLVRQNSREPSSTALFAYGRNTEGQCGRPPHERIDALTYIELLLESRRTILQVAAGRTHSLILTTEGLWGCGSNQYGKLGLLNTEICHSLTRITLPDSLPVASIQQIFANACASFLLTREGTLYSTGFGVNGGTLRAYSGMPTFAFAPINPTLLPPGRITQVAVADDLALAVVENGSTQQACLWTANYSLFGASFSVPHRLPLPEGRYSISASETHGVITTSRGVFIAGCTCFNHQLPHTSIPDPAHNRCRTLAPRQLLGVESSTPYWYPLEETLQTSEDPSRVRGTLSFVGSLLWCHMKHIGPFVDDFRCDVLSWFPQDP